MARRIEVELTSSRDDGTWTWRAAGARQPKGELGGDLLYPGAKVGDVVKVEAEFHLDGIEVTSVSPPKAAKSRPEVLELVSRPLRDDELVTTTRAARREGRRGDDRRRGPRGEGGRRDDRRREGGRREGGDRDRPRRDRSEAESRPKPKRLRPRRTHRDAVVAEVPEEYRPIAQRVLSGGMPEVRKALEEQNAAAKAEGKPEVATGPILAIAEDLLPKLRTAEWRDRADAALADLEQLDLRDLRSVVVAADAAARDEDSRAIADQLREGLNRRVEADHEQWMADLTAAVNEGRIVRALRLSSRPVKAGAPLPQDLAATMAEAASAALAPDISQERWATVLDAVAYSPVRGAIVPAGVPAEPSAELREAVTKVADRVPHIATMVGIDPAETARTRTRTRRARTRKPGAERAAGGSPKAAKAAAGAEAAAATPDGAVAEAVSGTTPAAEAPTTGGEPAAPAAAEPTAPSAGTPSESAEPEAGAAGTPSEWAEAEAGAAGTPSESPEPEAGAAGTPSESAEPQAEPAEASAEVAPGAETAVAEAPAGAEEPVADAAPGEGPNAAPAEPGSASGGEDEPTA